MVKTSMNESVNNETTTEKPFHEVEVLTERTDIVRKLNGICNQLLKWGMTHNVADARRAKFFRAAIYATSVQLQALKDKEIDQIMREIEAIKKHIGMKP